MFYFVFGTLVIAFLFWLTELKLRKRTKINDTSEVDNTELNRVPTKADVEKHNEQVRQQRAIARKKAEQRISSILDMAYKDYVNSRIKDNRYIDREFRLRKGEYGITYGEISRIDRPFTYNIYTVNCSYSDIFNEYYITVAVDHQRKED